MSEPSFSASSIVVPIVTGVVGFAAGFLVQDVTTAIGPDAVRPPVQTGPAGGSRAATASPNQQRQTRKKSLEKQALPHDTPSEEHPGNADDPHTPRDNPANPDAPASHDPNEFAGPPQPR